MHEFSQRLQITNYHSLHNVAGQVLRQPGNFDFGVVSPDEDIQKPLGDAEAAADGYYSPLVTAGDSPPAPTRGSMPKHCGRATRPPPK